MEIQVKIDFDFEHPSRNMKRIMSEFTEKALPNVEKQLKNNITDFKGAPISQTTATVRRIRNNMSKKPLIDSGALLKSIKKTKKGISFKKYGVFQDEGYRIKQKHAFYAPSKKARFKKLFKVGGAVVPDRKWIFYNATAEDYDLLFDKLMKSIKTINRVIARMTISF